MIVKTTVEQKPIIMTECDSCAGEVKEFGYSENDNDICRRCWHLLPHWAQHNIDTLCSIKKYVGDHVAWSRLATGIWVLWSGDEDRSSLSECGSLEEAEEAVLGMDEESDSDGYDLVDIFRDGRSMGATIKSKVVYEKKG